MRLLSASDFFWASDTEVKQWLASLEGADNIPFETVFSELKAYLDNALNNEWLDVAASSTLFRGRTVYQTLTKLCPQDCLTPGVQALQCAIVKQLHDFQIFVAIESALQSEEWVDVSGNTDVLQSVNHPNSHYCHKIHQQLLHRFILQIDPNQTEAIVNANHWIQTVLNGLSAPISAGLAFHMLSGLTDRRLRSVFLHIVVNATSDSDIRLLASSIMSNSLGDPLNSQDLHAQALKLLAVHKFVDAYDPASSSTAQWGGELTNLVQQFKDASQIGALLDAERMLLAFLEAHNLIQDMMPTTVHQRPSGILAQIAFAKSPEPLVELPGVSVCPTYDKLLAAIIGDYAKPHDNIIKQALFADLIKPANITYYKK